MHFTTHPLYRNEATVKAITEILLSAGQTVFQLFQYPGGEEEHSTFMLQLADPTYRCRRILSLGCGVAGMERYWQQYRPELDFELVNISQAQLNMIGGLVGNRVCADATDYHSDNGPFDMVVVSYLLGHVPVQKTLLSALDNLKPGGLLFVYDVFDGSEKFDRELFYASPKERDIWAVAGDENLGLCASVIGGIPMCPFFAKTHPWINDEVTPQLFVFSKP